MRAVYRLLGLARRHGDEAVNNACDKALQVDVISVTKIASMLERGTAGEPAPAPRPAAATATRFARDPGEYATSRTRMRLVHPTPANPATGVSSEEVR
jgi:hypothetical protein